MRWILVALVACGQDHMTSEAMQKPDAAPRPVPIDSVPELGTGCAVYAKAQCSALAKCSPNSSALTWAPGQCEPALERECKLQFAVPGSGVTEAWLQKCAAWSATQCPLDRDGGDCARPPGRFASGTACGIGIQCETGLCAKTRAMDPCGKCSTARPNSPHPDRGPKLGEKCTTDCGDSLHCDAGKCVAAKPRVAGETCTADMLGFPEGPRPCGPGLSCVGTDEQKCAKRPADGEACHPSGARCYFPANCREFKCTVSDPAACKR